MAWRPVWRRLRNSGAIGQVDTVSQSQLIIRNLSGGQHTYQLDAQTRYLDENGQPATAQELVSGRWVLVQATRSGLTAWVARTVYLLPAGFNPPEDLNLLVAGQLTGANAGRRDFQLASSQRAGVDLYLRAGRRVPGPDQEPFRLGTWDAVIVAGTHAAQGGSPTAYLVFARQRLARYAGSISCQ